MLLRILIVNPNTTKNFTNQVQSIAEKYASADTEVLAVTSESGPRSIESIYDELLSSHGTLSVLIENQDQFDAFMIACFSDHPVIYAMREMTEKPVLGIAEAAMYMACMLGHKFSVVTTNDAWHPLIWDAVVHYGLQQRCASVRTTGMAVLDLDQEKDQSYLLIRDEAKKALHEDGAEVICLGCAGMSGLDKRLENDIDIPVIDGVVAALKFLESLVRYGVHTSKIRAYKTPATKKLDNLPALFAKGYHG